MPNRLRHEEEKNILENSPPTCLPMRHVISQGPAKISCSEFLKYRHRRLSKAQIDSEYQEEFNRPKENVVDEIWNRLFPLGDEFVDIYADYIDGKWLYDHERSSLKHAARAALVIALDTFVTAGRNHRSIFYNDVFDALCQGYSDNFITTKAMHARDMSYDTAWRCRRDLLLNGVYTHKIWDFIVGSKIHPGGWVENPLFVVENPLRNSIGARKTVRLKDFLDLDVFINLLRSDSRYRRREGDGYQALIVGQDKKPSVNFDEYYEVCADEPYNKVQIGKNSNLLLEYQSYAQIRFDVDAFNQDYEAAERSVEKFSSELYDIGVDPLLPSAERRTSSGDSLWSERVKSLYYARIYHGLNERQYDSGVNPEARAIMDNAEEKATYENHIRRYREIYQIPPDEKMDLEEFIRAEIATRQWRSVATEKLKEFDRAHSFTMQFGQVRQQVKGLSGDQRITSGFYRLINRRYQSTNFWPTRVTNDPLGQSADGDEEQEVHNKSYRQRWFKSEDPGTGARCELKSFDISSSQTQIIAALMGIRSLEKESMLGAEKPFKDLLAGIAWKKHEDGGFKFLKSSMSVYGDYVGACDLRLKDLVKTLWMRDGYGAATKTIVESQLHDQDKYGPGWDIKDAIDFLKYDLYGGPFKEVKVFLEMCRHLAEVTDKYEGVVFVDPFDFEEVRWNPVERKEKRLTSNGRTIQLSVNKEPMKDGKHCVDKAKLRRMIAPCLVQMLDAYYSSLVMQNLYNDGITEFVGIHDCWMVPDKVDGRSGEAILEKAIRAADPEWYRGLEPIYQRLQHYLGDDPKYGEHVALIYGNWKNRVASNDYPRFKYSSE